MAARKTGQEEISERLHEALAGLRKDVTRVEIWATALGSFSQPVPDYRPDDKFELATDGNGAGDKPKKPAKNRPE